MQRIPFKMWLKWGECCFAFVFVFHTFWQMIRALALRVICFLLASEYRLNRSCDDLLSFVYNISMTPSYHILNHHKNDSYVLFGFFLLAKSLSGKIQWITRTKNVWYCNRAMNWYDYVIFKKFVPRKWKECCTMP